MRQSTSAGTETPGQARTLKPLGGDPSLGPMAGDALDLIIHGAAFGTGALTGLLVVRDTAEERLDVICACGTVPSQDRLSLVARRSGFVGRVLESGRTTGEPIARDDNALLATAASSALVRYAIGAPARPPGQAKGVLCVGLSHEPEDPATAAWIVESYAHVAALALHDGGALTGILAAARRDGLTGCLNYAALRCELEREIARSSRRERAVSCCFVDLDHFKLVNARHGHLHGSRVLAEVAARLRAEVRISDSVGRFGGDEFVVLLPDTDQDAAYTLAERLRARICATTEAGDEPLDASIGVAQWRPGMTAHELLAAADGALRKAKALGGGYVVGAGDVAAGAARGVAGGGSASPAPDNPSLAHVADQVISRQ